MSDLTPESVLTISPDVVSQELEGELVILSLDRAEYFGLNATGTHVWKSVIDGRCLHEAAIQLVQAFDVEFDRALADVLALAHALVHERLAAAGDALPPR